jgi:hypothetical protein
MLGLFSSLEIRDGVLRIEVRQRHPDGTAPVVGLLACALTGQGPSALAEIARLALEEHDLVLAEGAPASGRLARGRARGHER